MKLLPRLSLDQVGHTPGRPQAGAIAQHLGTLFQSAAQLIQLGGLQPRSTTGPTRLIPLLKRNCTILLGGSVYLFGKPGV
jgi:hypothetical protein